jgi:hypothetical protein
VRVVLLLEASLFLLALAMPRSDNRFTTALAMASFASAVAVRLYLSAPIIGLDSHRVRQ